MAIKRIKIRKAVAAVDVVVVDAEAVAAVDIVVVDAEAVAAVDVVVVDAEAVAAEAVDAVSVDVAAAAISLRSFFMNFRQQQRRSKASIR